MAPLNPKPYIGVGIWVVGAWAWGPGPGFEVEGVVILWVGRGGGVWADGPIFLRLEALRRKVWNLDLGVWGLCFVVKNFAV